MKTRTFIRPSNGERVTTSDKAEIKMMRACGWKEYKKPKEIFVKGLKDGKTYLDK